MGKVIRRNQPCLNPECKSHDARQVYEDLTSFCFSCSTWFGAGKEQVELTEEPQMEKVEIAKSDTKLAEIDAYESRGFKERGITKPIAQFYNVRVSYNEKGEIDTHYYPYGEGEKRGYKIRKLPKSFSYTGTPGGLFGRHLFNGGGKRLIITEGEIDALTMAQASFDRYKKHYPIIALPSASSTAQLLENRDWIRSFQEVVLCLDNDSAGEEATKKALKIIGIDKAKIAKLPLKDPSDVFLKFGGERLLECVWSATYWTPAGIIKKDALWDALTNYNDVHAIPYPACLEGVNLKLKGMRSGEIVLLISGTGSGKSTILREILVHLIQTEKTAKVGIISLEESPAETARKISGMALNRNPAEEEIPIAELKVGFDTIFGDDRIVLLDHQGSIKDSSIVDQLEYMALMGCTHLMIDHITILVSEGADGLTGNEAIDKIMNDLLRLTKKHPIWIGLISHLRKTSTGGRSFEQGKLPSIDDIRGSGSIKQISHDIIAFARDLTADDEQERNTIKMSVLKARYTGLTGPIPGAWYNRKTGRLSGLKDMPDENFELA